MPEGDVGGIGNDSRQAYPRSDIRERPGSKMNPENAHGSTVSEQTRSQSHVSARTLRIKARETARSSLKLGREVLACFLMYLMIPFGVGDMFAQSAPPPPPDQSQAPPDQSQGGPPQNYNALSPDQLNQLVAPIALYPDSLVAQVLAASTFPTQIVDADRFVQSNQGAPPDQLGQMADGMQWDPSVKALIAFPSVLANLDKNLDWTSQLGNAYFNQPTDVMSAVQVMRQRAYDAGNLKSNQQQAVTYQPNNIVIAPANPAVVYVPYYSPTVVYGAPVAYWGGYYPPPPPPGYALGVGLAIGFGVGIAVASWNHWGWGYHNWGVGWGGHGGVVYNRNVYVSRSTTVINRGYYGGYDRNVAARNYNRTVATHSVDYRNTTVNRNVNNNVNRNVNNNVNRNVNNNVNRNVNNNANRNVNNNNANNANRNNANNSGTNRPANGANNNRPANTNNYNRPGTTPGANNANNRPTNTNNYHPPANNSNNRPAANNSRPANTNSRSASQSRPAPQSKSAPQAKSNGGGHPRNK